MASRAGRDTAHAPGCRLSATGGADGRRRCTVDAAVAIERLAKSFGGTRALDGLDLEVRVGESPRLAGPERRRQDDDHPRAARPAARRLGRGPAARRRPLARRGAPASPPGLRARRGDPVAEPHRRRGDRPARAAARRPRREAPRRPAGALRARPDQEGARLLQGQPAEGRARGRALVGRRAAAARRADRRPRPADGRGVPRVPRRAARPGTHRAALEPHPLRGGGARRPREHHPRRPQGRGGQPRRDAPPRARLHLRRPRRRA